MEKGLQPEKWKGYTIDEIQYQKALVLLRLEMQKERLASVRNGSAAFMSGRFGKVLSAVSSHKNIFAYLFAGYKLYTLISRLRQNLKRKK